MTTARLPQSLRSLAMTMARLQVFAPYNDDNGKIAAAAGLLTLCCADRFHHNGVFIQFVDIARLAQHSATHHGDAVAGPE